MYRASCVVAVVILLFSFSCTEKSIKEAVLKKEFTYSCEQKSQLEELFNKYDENRRFHGVLLVGQKDSVFFSQAAGIANHYTNDSITLSSSFQLASVSKQFTAVAILKLYQEGKLKLTDSVQRYFPDFPYYGITIHMLLVHRSGLPNYHYFMNYIPTSYDTLLTNTDLVNELINRQPSIYCKPDRKYSYSNTGYALLASIVEKVSGKLFADYLKEEIFQPLGMHNSFAYRADRTTLYPPRVTGYIRYWREAEDNYLDGVLGDKGVYSSAYDLFLWDQSLYKGTIVHTDTLALAFQPMGRPLKARINYGYGWRIMYWGNDSVKVNFHYGWWHGFKSLLMQIPQDTTTVVVLKNCTKGQMIKAVAILKILYPQQDTIAGTDFPESDE